MSEGLLPNRAVGMPATGPLYSATLNASDYTGAGAYVNLAVKCRHVAIVPQDGCARLHVMVGAAATTAKFSITYPDMYIRTIGDGGVDKVYVLAASATGSFCVEAY